MFNINIGQSVEEAGAPTLMEEHVNTFIVTKAELVKSSTSLSEGVNIEATIVGEKYNGRKVYDTFWIKGKDGSDNMVAASYLGTLGYAVGIEKDQQLTSESQLMTNQPFEAKVIVEKSGNTEYQDKNKFKFPKRINTASVAQQPQQAAPQQQTQGFGSQSQGFGNQSTGGFGQGGFGQQ